MRYALSDYLEIYVTKWDELVEEFLRHLSMTSLAVLLALVIGVPLGIFITRHKKLSAVVIAVANVMQSIPCMALLALGIPVFGIGEKLAVFMVFIVLGMNSRNYPLTLMGAVAASVMALALDFLLGRVEKAVTSEGLLPPDQIKNLSRTVRRRRRNVAWGLCVALIGVSVLSYAALI